MFETDDEPAMRSLIVSLVCLSIALTVVALFAGFFASFSGELGRWLIGLGFGIAAGGCACWYFLEELRYKYIGIPKDTSRGIPNWLVGIIEQLIFVVAVGAVLSDPDSKAHIENLGEIFAVMALWLAAKMLTGWNRADLTVGRSPYWQERALQQKRQDDRAKGSLTALLAGVLSLAIATVGGNIAANGAVVKSGARLVSDGYAIYWEAAVWTWCHFVPKPPV